MSVGALEALPALLLVNEKLRSARLAHHDARHFRAGDERGTDVQAVILADSEDFGQRHLRALLEGLFREALDTHDVALGDAYLLAPGPDNCVHAFTSTSQAKRPTKIPDRDTAVKAASVLADLVRQLVRVHWPRLREEEGERVAEPVHRRDDALCELP